MPPAADIVARLDELLRQVAALRDEVAASVPPAAGNGLDAGDDFAEHHLIDPASGQTRFSVPQDTLRKWARESEGTEQAIGFRRGSRWLLSIPKVRKRIGLER
jgi:hypothetical protein